MRKVIGYWPKWSGNEKRQDHLFWASILQSGSKSFSVSQKKKGKN